MVNENRVILMTRMASYESNEGKKNKKIGNYFRSDYIAIQILKSLIYGTVAFAIVFALYVFYDFEEFMLNSYKLDLVVFAQNVLRYYLISIAVYLVLTYVVCTYRYVKAKSGLKLYYNNLKKLGSFYKSSDGGRTAGGRS